MSKIGNFLFIRIIFNVLFSAVQRKKTFNFERWAIAKPIFDRRINRVAIKYINSKKLNLNSKKKMLLTLAIFLRLAFKVRTFVFFKIIPYRKTKSIWLLFALVLIHFYAYKKIFLSFLNLGKSYSFDFNANNKKIIFVIGFPAHSFNYAIREKSLVASSFAEYLKANSNLEKDFDTILVSVDEYTRNSKALESDIPKRHHDTFNILTRYQIKKTSSFISFLINSYFALRLFFREYLSLSALQLLEFSSRVNLIPYHRLFLKLKRQIDTIYVLPFSEFEYLNFDSEYLGKLKTFYYSENMLIPPLISDSDDVNLHFSDGNFSSLGNFGSFVGFTEIASRLKRIGSLVFCKSPPAEDFISEFPCMLGYEEPLFFLKKEGCFVLSIFDVPPEDDCSQLNRSLIGDMTANLEFIDTFLADFTNLNINRDFVILYKPKYSLKNYSKDYKKIINYLIDKFDDKFILLDPYVRLEDIMKITDLAISFPYTSTYKFAKHSGVKSFFYIPDAYVKDFLFFGKRNDCLYGIESINLYISNLR